ncbi:hypothetical protein [Anaerococcus porci]|uniref:hypothetical protein n=1 Tax=Anaerococcus porci TaxID=2652269 RepID=UPI001E4C44ED|nr:hypothetical protein [Anaerococcus porci]MDY3005974.1 hypothetical protein [Anaerococcus porci]
MNNFINVLIEKKEDLIKAIFEHLQISLIALFIAMIIAIPFAISIAKNKKTPEFTLQVTGNITNYTIFSLLGAFYSNSWYRKYSLYCCLSNLWTFSNSTIYYYRT